MQPIDQDLISIGQQLVSFRRANPRSIPSAAQKAHLNNFALAYPLPQGGVEYPPIWLDRPQERRQILQEFLLRTPQFSLGPIRTTTGSAAPSPSASPVRTRVRANSASTEYNSAAESNSASTEYTVQRPGSDRMATTPAPETGLSDSQMTSLVETVLRMMEERSANRPNQQRQDPVTLSNDPARYREGDVGFFQPDLPASFGAGDVVTVGKDTYIRDVTIFTDRLKDAVATYGLPAIRAKIPSMLRGSALNWYTSVLDGFTKTGLRHADSLEEWTDRLTAHFARPMTESMNRLQKTRYSLQDANSARPIAEHVYDVARLCRNAGMDQTHVQINHAYMSLDPALRASIPVPDRSTTMADFVRNLENQRENWTSMAPRWIQLNRLTDRPNQGNLPPTRRDRPSVERSTFSPPARHFGQYGYTPRPYADYQRPYPSQNQPNFGQRPHSGGQAGGPMGSQSAPPNPSASGFRPLPAPRQPLAITSGNAQPPGNRPSGRTYGRSGNNFDRNRRVYFADQQEELDCGQLEEEPAPVDGEEYLDEPTEGPDQNAYHIDQPNDSQGDPEPSGRGQGATVAKMTAARTNKPKEKAILKDGMTTPRYRHTTAFASFSTNSNASSFPLCIDTGAGFTFIDSQLLATATGHKRVPIGRYRVGTLGEPVYITQHAEFALHFLTQNGDKRSRFTVECCSAVVDRLPAGILLGMNILKPLGIRLDYSNDRMIFKNDWWTPIKSTTSFTAYHLSPGPKDTEGLFGCRIWGDPTTFDQFQSLLHRYENLFTDDGKVAKISEEERMPIVLKPNWEDLHVKVAHRVYNVGPQARAAIDRVHDKLHQQGRMKWADEPTPFASPIFVVNQQSDLGSKARPVVDIRSLNKVTVSDTYPMPLQSDIIAAVAGCTFITTVDATAFFYQWLVRTSDIPKLSVVSHRGQEFFKVVVMGFKNAPPYTQRQMDRILREAGAVTFARAFVDNITIFSHTLEEHLEHLRIVFDAFQDRNLTLSGPKSFIGFPSIPLLGQQVTGYGLSTSEAKLEAIRSLQFPKTMKDLESYLGFTGWLRHFIPYYAQLVDPLQRRKTLMAKQAPVLKSARKLFTTSAEVEADEELVESFMAVQKAFDAESMLVHFDRSRPLYIHLDASKQRGFGVMVAHLKGDEVTDDPVRTRTEPVLFLSKVLSTAERRYWATELEVACLVWTIRRIRWMVEAAERPVVVLTDHAATTSIAKQTSLTSSSVDKLNNRLIRASQYLSSFRNLDIRYRPGRVHVVPDALSRLTAQSNEVVKDDDDPLEDLMTGYHASSTLEIDPNFKKQLSLAYQADKYMSGIFNRLADGVPFMHFRVEDDLLWLDSTDQPTPTRLCIPKALVTNLFELVHDERFHVGFHRIYEKLRTQFFIRKLSKRLRQYLKHCDRCNSLQTTRHKSLGHSEPIVTPPVPFHTIAIDFVTALPACEGINSLCTVTCKFSKKILLVAGADDLAAEAWAHRLLDNLLSADWGLPSAIISDRDPKFLSTLWQTWFARLGTKLLMSVAYHPQTDGQSERTNQTVEIALRFHIAKYPDAELEWIYALPQLQFALNSSINAATGRTPNEICLGFRPREPVDLMGPANDQSRDFERVRKEAADSVVFAQVEMKLRQDAGKDRWQPVEGATVMLRTRNYRIPGIVNRKLGPPRIGPFVVKKVIPNGLACELALPAHYRIHPVVSITEIEPLSQDLDPFDRPRRQPVRTDIRADVPIAEKVLDQRDRIVGRSRKLVTEYLIRWRGLGVESDQWMKAGDDIKLAVDRWRRKRKH
ncbi:hypothetical protein CAC42_5319 [Sphaceloma murrayae]|uniref:RNA-directed DNA polymerase n=1 Tax=Sphaceloma murrayae TaxID=2082308 RepID=A0A2K1QV01_9PEZI|nr:hypothetical protein CAC42_5319 [Sphaceloma murrayae]